jgi:F-type H+-transporting ATPase subunit gamma
MATLREIQNRITSIKSTQQITKAMKMVAAAKLRRAQENILAFRPYSYEIRNLIAHLVSRSANLEGIPLLQRRPVEKVLQVVVASDRGLCGAFNSSIFRQAVQRAADYSTTEASIFAVGKKSLEFFGKRDYQIQDNNVNFFNHLKFDNALEISRSLVSLYTSGAFDRIEIVYNEFKSAIQQNVVVEQFLPFVPDEEMMKSASQVDFLYEPDKIEILNTIIPMHLNIQIWRVLLESNAAEQGARMTAMENATENAQELVGKLTIYYNRTRQAKITTEISEIVSGAEALSES